MSLITFADRAPHLKVTDIASLPEEEQTRFQNYLHRLVHQIQLNSRVSLSRQQSAIETVTRLVNEIALDRVFRTGTEDPIINLNQLLAQSPREPGVWMNIGDKEILLWKMNLAMDLPATVLTGTGVIMAVAGVFPILGGFLAAGTVITRICIEHCTCN